MKPDLELPLFQVTPADPNVTWLVDLLQSADGWMTAREISAASLGRVNDREIRALAAATDLVISGQRGYRHLHRATVAEIGHASSWLISQGRQMIRRGIAQRRRAHQSFGGGR